MSRFRYSATCKVEAVRRVVEDGHRVCDVAVAMDVSEGSLFFWVRRYRQLTCRQRESCAWMPVRPARPKPLRNGEAGSLVAWLRRADR